MRLGKTHMAAIESVVSRALAGECRIEVPAPTPYLARKLFEAATPELEARGGRPDRRRLHWVFPNDSLIVVRAAA